MCEYSCIFVYILQFNFKSIWIILHTWEYICIYTLQCHIRTGSKICHFKYITLLQSFDSEVDLDDPEMPNIYSEFGIPQLPRDTHDRTESTRTSEFDVDVDFMVHFIIPIYVMDRIVYYLILYKVLL